MTSDGLLVWPDGLPVHSDCRSLVTLDGAEHAGHVSTRLPRASGQPRVADVLRRHVPPYLTQFPSRLSRQQRAVLLRLVECRGPSLGVHAWHCSWCGHTHVAANTCHDRHCPDCGRPDREKWLMRVSSWALETTYLHVVFTLPHEFAPLALSSGAALYGLLLTAAKETLQSGARGHYEAVPGLVLVLHTWGQRMTIHPHVHVVHTAGGLSLDESCWVPFSVADEVFARDKLAERFRERFLAGLVKLYRQQKLLLPGSMAWIRSEADLDRWLKPVRAQRWCVHCEGPPPGLDGPTAVLRYLSRYVSGTAIHDGRIVSDDGERIVIVAKNYRTGEQEELVFSPEQFVTRFAFHILPRGFRRLRYSGIFSPHERSRRLAVCHALLAGQAPLVPASVPVAAMSTTEPASSALTVAEAAGAADAAPTDATPLDPSSPPEQPPAPEPERRPCPRCLLPGMAYLGRFNPPRAYWLTVDLQAMWRMVVTIVITLPYGHASIAEHPRETWTCVITTLEVPDIAGSCHGHSPEPGALAIELPVPDT